MSEKRSVLNLLKKCPMVHVVDELGVAVIGANLGDYGYYSFIPSLTVQEVRKHISRLKRSILMKSELGTTMVKIEDLDHWVFEKLMEHQQIPKSEWMGTSKQ